MINEKVVCCHGWYGSFLLSRKTQLLQNIDNRVRRTLPVSLYLDSIPGDVKYPIRGTWVTAVGTWVTAVDFHLSTTRVTTEAFMTRLDLLTTFHQDTIELSMLLC